MGKAGVSVVVAGFAAAIIYFYPTFKGQTGGQTDSSSGSSSPAMVFNVTVIRQ